MLRHSVRLARARRSITHGRYVLPGAVGGFPPGTVLWAGSFGQNSTPRQMSLRVWASLDAGATWQFASVLAATTTEYGLWEPEFAVDINGTLVAAYSDETDPLLHSQRLMLARSSNVVTWSTPVPVVQSDLQAVRPGMAIIRILPCAPPLYVMAYEVCGATGAVQCIVHYRTSMDGWDWGNPANLGSIVVLERGALLAHTPSLAVVTSPAGTAAALIATGQGVFYNNGTMAQGSGGTLAVLAVSRTCGIAAEATWQPAPVDAPWPLPETWCPNYSPALLSIGTAPVTRVLELTSQFLDGTACWSFFNSSAVPIPGQEWL